MSKVKSRLLSFVVSIVISLSFQALSTETLQELTDNWHEHKQWDNGLIEYRNVCFDMKYSWEKLDPQESRPSLDCNLWLAKKDLVQHMVGLYYHIDASYYIVSPEGTLGTFNVKFPQHKEALASVYY